MAMIKLAQDRVVVICETQMEAETTKRLYDELGATVRIEEVDGKWKVTLLKDPADVCEAVE